MTISSRERPNIVFGSIRLIQCRWRISRVSSRVGRMSNDRLLIAASSVRTQRIAGAAHRLQVAWIARIGLDLAAQPVHLHVDVADIAAELRRLRQFLARYGLRCVLRE